MGAIFFFSILTNSDATEHKEKKEALVSLELWH